MNTSKCVFRFAQHYSIYCKQNTLSKNMLLNYRILSCQIVDLNKPRIRFNSDKSTERKSAGDGQRTGKEIDITRENPYAGLTMGQKVKEAGKDVSYLGIIILGIGVTGAMFYAIGKELFSKESSSGIYGDALKLCKQDTRIIDNIGEPIKGYGETTRRGRRRFVSHSEFEVDGVMHMRMKFYIEGPLRKGTVYVEVKQNENKKYEYKYLIVELDGYPHRTFALVDNR